MRNLGLIAALAGALLLGACKDEKKSRGLEVLPDMFHSPAYESQQTLSRADDATDAGARTVRRSPMLLRPPAGTVARTGASYAYAPGESASASALTNPLLSTSAVLRTGQALYATQCLVCHGADGGDKPAPVAAFIAAPKLNTLSVAAQSDGALFHVITTGKNNRMPGLAAQLSAQERWAVVHYLRAVSGAAQAVRDPAELAKAVEGELRLAITDPAVIALSKRLAAYRALLASAGDGHEFLLPPPPRPEHEPLPWPGQAPAHAPSHH